MRRLRKFIALTSARRAIVLRSLLLLPTVAAMLRMRGMGRTTTWIERLRPRSEDDALPPRDIARLVDAAASLLGARCLSRSLVLWHLLRIRGVSAELRLGVSKPISGRLLAHAWVELDGEPLNDGPDVCQRYVGLCRWQSNAPHPL